MDTVKLILYWDLIDDRDVEYFEFLVKDLIPTITELGLQTVEAWYVYYGGDHEYILSCIADDIGALRRMLKSAKWAELVVDLLEYVTNYDQKIIPAKERLQL